MKAAFTIFAALSITAAEPIILGPITPDAGIAIEKCHPGDRALVHVEPLYPSAQAVEGWFETTNAMLTLRDLTMVSAGTNLMEFRTVCRGMTSDVVTVMFEIRRAPTAPRISRRRAHPMAPQPPPLPAGMAPALPGGTNQASSYADYRRRLDRAQAYGMAHRSQ